ncbi:MAG: MAE_28990/MAE_18760 family HEPN-like nuclease [Bacteroidota bacterium]
MQDALNDFRDTVKEVEVYFDFLEKIEDLSIGVPHITYSPNHDHNEVRHKIDEQLVKILKANAFLLLYNLVEATVKNGIWEIILAIKNDKITYNKLRKELKEVWLGQKIKLAFKSRDQEVVKKVYKIVESALSNSLDFYANKEYIRFESGNLSIATIQKTTKKYGVSTKVSVNHSDQGEAFMKTKIERNHLAHGDKTFATCGKDYPLSLLVQYKDYIIEYLRRTLITIEDSIEQKEFRVLVV